jgi:multidrug efflux pump subunit AcrA (membrane-fusion protein)
MMNPITFRRRANLFSAAVLLSAAVSGCSAPQAAGTVSDAAAPITVTVAKVEMADVSSALDQGGVVQARMTAAITARIVAPIREVRVLPGDLVHKGQTLIVLDGDDLSAAARAARSAAGAAEQGARAAAAELETTQAGLNLARASYDRIAGLQTRGSATAQELDDATAALRTAEARVSAASARVSQAASALESARASGDQAAATESFTRIAAPFDGMVSEKLIEPGNTALPGMTLLRVEDIRDFRLEVRVDEARTAEIRNGVRVPVFLGSSDTPITGTVVEVSRAVDADTRAFLVKIVLPDATDRRSGQFGKARFPGPTRRALVIPASAIVRRGQLTSVFVVEQGRARVRLVNIDESEVLAGLSESEVVVISPPPGLVDGARITVGGR